MASSSSIQTVSSSISASCSTSQCEYDVFLSFRGEDTRNNFTDHLYHALDGQGISVFRDTEELRRGQPISRDLFEAIETSRVAVVVLSQHYASSTWCLKELAKIMERWEAGTVKVLPIFYHVDPSVVRHQRGTFGDAFVKHDEGSKENKEEVQSWKNALRKVADLAGYDSKDRPESELISEVVENIDDYLNDITTVGTSAYDKDLIGIEPRYQEALLWMNMESDNVRFIGMTGISGIGKTTLAEVVFRRIRRKFQASSFINAREHASNLRQKLLCDLGVSSPRTCTGHRAMDRILDKFGTKKVLIILDDMDSSKLDQLATECECFGPGSKIIIIAEDKNLLLKKCKKEDIHEVKRLNHNDALQLFRSNALRQTHSEKESEDVCREFVRYADGHPLALKVLGSYLLGKDTGLWKSVLEELREDSNDDIKKALEISWKGLGAPQKELFLDIACFFNGEDKDRVMNILIDSHPIREHHLHDLIEKSLITILGRRLRMHNLLQEMGRQIVQKGDQSRLWLWGDFQSAQNTNQRPQSIKGIMLNLPTAQDNPLNAELQETDQQNEMDSIEEIMLPLNAEAFSAMTNLRLLKICNVQLPQGLSYLPSTLRMMEWSRYPLPSLPRTFHPRELVELIMHGSHIKELPKGFKLNRLKILDLKDSESLVKTPNFNDLPNLKELSFQGCTRLTEVHPSIGFHRMLILLDMKDCKCLKGLPCEINMESLKTFVLSGCSNLKAFPDIGPSMTGLLELHLNETPIDQLPSSMERLSGLTCLDLQNCKNFLSFPDIIWSLRSLKNLNLSGFRIQQPKSRHSGGLSPLAAAMLVLCTSCLFGVQHPESQPNILLLKSLPELSSLESLDLSDCNLEDGALPEDLRCFSSLRSFNLSRNKFTSLPDSISQLSQLETLSLVGCSGLQSLPLLPLSIKRVEVQECKSLENYSNKLVLWTSGDAGLTFIEGRLSDHKSDNSSKIPSVDAKRYMEKNLDEWGIFYGGFYSQTEIPEWFHEKKEGSSVTFQIPFGLYENSNWTGMALNTVFEFLPDQGSEYYHRLIMHLDIDVDPIDLPFPSNKLCHGSFGVLAYIKHTCFRHHLDGRRYISPSIEIKGRNINIKQCGARILYKKDMVEFVQIMHPEAFKKMYPKSLVEEEEPSPSSSQSDSNAKSLVEEEEPSPSSSQSDSNAKSLVEEEPSASGGRSDSNAKNLVEEEEPSAFGGQSDSNARLKRELQSLTLLLFQRDIAQNHWSNFIFPQKGIPRWFRHQFVSSNVLMSLPTNLHNDARWMGFTVCASIHKQLALPSQDSEIVLKFSAFSADGGAAIESYSASLLFRDVFVESQRILILHIPRMLFKSNTCTMVWASFQSDNPDMEIEMCGIDLLYEHEIGAFVQTLVQCMLECPDEYHQAIYRNLVDQIAWARDRNRGTFKFCPLSAQRSAERMTKLQPSIENVAEDCTSPAAFQSQAIAEKLSTNRSPSSRFIGIAFGEGRHRSPKSEKILASLFEGQFQESYKCGNIDDFCFPESEIPKLFSHQIEWHSMKIQLHPTVYNAPFVMGLAFCALFSFHKHPTAIHGNLDSPLPHNFMCFIETDSGYSSLLLKGSFSEGNVLISLCKRAFIWVLFIPPKALQCHGSPNEWAKFSFKSGSPDLAVLKCGARYLTRDDMEAFSHTIAQLGFDAMESHNHTVKINERLPACPASICETDNSHKDQPTQASPSYMKDAESVDSWPCIVSICESDKSRKDQTTQASPSCTKDAEWVHPPTWQVGPLDFSPFLNYTYCFPPSKTTQDWFGQRNHGYSVTIDIPPNVYSDHSWLGLVTYACFSRPIDLQAHTMTLFPDMEHFLFCNISLSAGLDDQLVGCKTHRKEIMWLQNLGHFIWIHFLPAGAIGDLRHCNHIEASFASDRPGVVVENCALRLLYDHDQCEFLKKLRHCNNLISEYEECDRRLSDYFATFEPHVCSKGLLLLGLGKPEGHRSKIDLLDFDGCSRFDLCLHPRVTLDCFNHLSNGPSVTIDVPANLHDDRDLMGFLLCAHFSVDEHQTAIIEMLNSKICHHLHCFLESNVVDTDPELHFYCVTKENLWRFWTPDGFLWITYIPQVLFPDWLNQCSCLEASFVSHWPGITVKKCGYKFFQMQDKEKLELIVYRCILAYETQHLIQPPKAYFLDERGTITTINSDLDLQNQDESKGTKNQDNLRKLQDFDPFVVCTSCFPPNEILDWFNQQSDEPTMIIIPPPNLHDDPTWIGLALCVYFSVQEHSTDIATDLDLQARYHLFCQLDGIKPSLTHFLTKEDLKLLQLGGFIWMAYIPHQWFSNCLNQRSHIEVSIKAVCPGLTIQKCGFHFLLQSDEKEWKEMIRWCDASFSQIQDFLYQVEETPEEQEKPNPISNFEEDFRPEAYTDDKIGAETTSSSIVGQQNEAPRRSFDRGESEGTKNQDNVRKLEDFDSRAVCTSCFPSNEILDWFGHQSEEPNMIVTPPPNLHNDSTWMGLAMCVYFSVQEQSTNIVTDLDSQIHYLLFCHSKGIKPSHTHFLTKEDLKLLRLGRFIWMSYIPRQWFSNWLNQSSHIEASIRVVCPGLTMQKCGFRFLFQNDEMEWKETIRQCEASFSEETVKAILKGQEKPNIINSSKQDKGKPKDKGKAIIE